MARSKRARAERSARLTRAAFVALALVAAAVPSAALVFLLPDYAIAASLLGVLCGAGAIAILWKRAAVRDLAEDSSPKASARPTGAGRCWDSLRAFPAYRRRPPPGLRERSEVSLPRHRQP